MVNQKYIQEVLKRDPSEEDLSRMWNRLVSSAATVSGTPSVEREIASPSITVHKEKMRMFRRGEMAVAAVLALALVLGALYLAFKQRRSVLVPSGQGDGSHSNSAITAGAKIVEERKGTEDAKEENERIQSLLASTNQQYTLNAPVYPAEKALKITDVEIPDKIDGMYWRLTGMPAEDYLLLALSEEDKATDSQVGVLEFQELVLYRISDEKYETIRSANDSGELRSKIYPQADGKMLIVDFPIYPDALNISLYDIEKGEETLLVSLDKAMELYESPTLSNEGLVYAPYVLEEQDELPPVLLMDLESKETTRLPDMALPLTNPEGKLFLLKYSTDPGQISPMFEMDTDAGTLMWSEHAYPLHTSVDHRVAIGMKDVYDIHMNTVEGDDWLQPAILYNKSQEKVLLEFGQNSQYSKRMLFGLDTNKNFLSWNLDYNDWPKMVYDIENERFLLFEDWGELGPEGYQMTYLVPGRNMGVIASMNFDEAKENEEGLEFQGDNILTRIGKTRMKIFEIESDED